MTERSWLNAFVRTAGLRLCVLPLSAALALLTAGLMMHFASVAAFGIITMVGQLQLALPFADVGLGAAVARAVARGRTSAEQRAVADELVRRTAALLAIIGLCGASAAVGAGALGLWSAWFEVPTSLSADLDVVMTVVLVMFFLGLPLGLSERILVGQDRADLLVILGLIPAVCNLGLAVMIGTLGLRPMWLALGLPIGTVIFLVMCSRASGLWQRLLNGTTAGGAHTVSMRGIFLGGLPVLVTTAGVVLAEQHGRFVLSTLASPMITSEYALGLYLYMPVYSVLYMAATVLWPRFAAGIDVRMWKQANAALILLGAGAALGYLVFARPLSHLVSSGELTLTWPVVLSFAAVFLAQSAHLTQANLLTDVRGFTRQAMMATALLLSVVPMSALGVHLGVAAAAPAAAMTLGVLSAQVIPGMLITRRVIAEQHRRSVTEPRSPSGSAAGADLMKNR